MRQLVPFRTLKIGDTFDFFGTLYTRVMPFGGPMYPCATCGAMRNFNVVNKAVPGDWNHFCPSEKVMREYE